MLSALKAIMSLMLSQGVTFLLFRMGKRINPCGTPKVRDVEMAVKLLHHAPLGLFQEEVSEPDQYTFTHPDMATASYD